MAMRNFTADELASYGFTDAELSMYDSDEPQPGRPCVWLLGIKSTELDYARHETWRRRNDIERVTNFDFDAFLEAEAKKGSRGQTLPICAPPEKRAQDNQRLATSTSRY